MKNLVILLFIFANYLYSNVMAKEGFVVKDLIYNLIWQDNKETTFMLGSQDEAIKYCKQLILNEYSNRKLPIKEQYQHIIDKTRKGNIKMNKTFKNVLQVDYWISSRTWRALKIWILFFTKSGNIYYENRIYPKF